MHTGAFAALDAYLDPIERALATRPLAALLAELADEPPPTRREGNPQAPRRKNLQDGKDGLE